MSSSMALWDYATPYFPADYLRPRGTHEPHTCERWQYAQHWTAEERRRAIDIEKSRMR